MSTAIVHIAGPAVQIGALLRQRCAWCGATLIDYDLERVAVPEGQDPTPATWPPAELVMVDVSGVSAVVEHADGNQLPHDACARLDPAVTA